MSHRRNEDKVFDRIQNLTGTARPAELSQVAFGWLHEILRSEFAAEPDFSRTASPQADGGSEERRTLHPCAPGSPLTLAAQEDDPFGVAARFARGEVEDALWYREWHQQWRRFQLPDQLVAYYEDLGRARTPTDVYDALTEHAVRIVGGYTALLFPPRQDAGDLRPVPNPRLHPDTAEILLPPSPPLPRAESIAAADAQAGGSPFARLLPLFTEERAVSLAHAAFGDGGVIFVIERRQERIFGQEDWDLLRTLSAQAEAALERVRLFNLVAVLASTDPLTGLAGREQAATVLQQAWAAAVRGQHLAVAVLDLEESGPASAAPARSLNSRALRDVADVLRRETRLHSLAARYGDSRFLLILPRTDFAGAWELVARIQARLGQQVRLRVGVAQYHPGAGSAEELIETAAGTFAGALAG